MNISYEESLEIRGIAILMMLWLHCFCNWSSPEYTYIRALVNYTVANLTL